MRDDIKTFEEVEAFFGHFLSNPGDPLYGEILRMTPNIETLIQIMLRNIRYAMEHDGEAEEATLLDGDVARLSMLNMYLPFFTLSEEYEAMPAFVAHYALLVRNYCNLYGDWAERMSRTLESTEKLVMTERNFSKLLVVSQQLLARYDMMRQYCPETLKISKRYLDFLAADGDIKKEEIIRV